jgi:hypothetical protein
LSGEGKPITQAISPTLFLHEKAPPAILFYGTADNLSVHGNESHYDKTIAAARLII